ncbi:MAG TPA: glutaredoxin [Chloroflexi bacterium]|jgi:glutaredoxin-like protein|nr:glutaredoxin [Chloroflexota bacterium]
MALLSDKDREFLQNHFEETLIHPVKLVFFTQEIACQFCRETGQILDEVASLSDKITVETYNFVTDKEVAERYGIDKIPATIVMGDVDYGIRFYGIPSGYEFTSLIEDIVDVSRGKTDLLPETREVLARIEEPVHIQVFVTPTCPYCPIAVRLAHKLAIANENVRADMVEAIEFPHLANRYSVYGVPRTVINEETHLEGAAPELLFVAKVQEAVGLMSPAEVEELMEEYLAQGEELPEESLEGEG